MMCCWPGRESELHEFQEFLNSLDADMKLTLVWSREEVQFLDTKVVIENHTVTNRLHRNATDRNTLLKIDSCHPRKIVKSLPYSQFVKG